MVYYFDIIQPSHDIWRLIEQSEDSTCFHTEKWNNYIQRIGFKTVVISVACQTQPLGYFIGERIGKGALSIIAAPFNGIGTYTQGFVRTTNICISEIERIAIYQALAEWLFDNHLACMLQVDDWQLRRTSKDWIPYEVFKQDTLEACAIDYSVRPTLCVPVNVNDEQMWAGLHYKSAKYSINKARKLGLYVREITDKSEIAAFTQYHYEQLKEVCARQGMRPKPSQSQKRMQALCEELFPERIIMLECIGPVESGKEEVMSTGIFCLDKGQSVYWTGASFQRFHKYCPNELMVWEAMRIAHQRGAGLLNFAGMASYKLKFGTVYEYVPRLSFTKFPMVRWTKDFLQHAYFDIRTFMAKIIGKHSYK